jgi:hypothetical protein
MKQTGVALPLKLTQVNLQVNFKFPGKRSSFIEIDLQLKIAKSSVFFRPTKSAPPQGTYALPAWQCPAGGPLLS